MFLTGNNQVLFGFIDLEIAAYCYNYIVDKC